MLVLGLSGGVDRIHTNKIAVAHDSAAVLMRDGKVVAAIEEERLNRIKHTNKFPTNAIRACLRIAGARLRDLDRVAFNYTEEGARAELMTNVLTGRAVSRLLGMRPEVDTSPRALLQAVMELELGEAVEQDRLWFVKHHVAHAYSAFGPSGFDRALVVTMDGQGEDESGYVAIGDARGIEVLRTTSVADSVGQLYSYVTHFLGFKFFDEFKVMGLVPYGDPSVYRSLFRELYTLGPEGTYTIHVARLLSLAEAIPPRQPQQPFDQQYKNVAAALQESLETIAFHVLEHHRKATGLTKLAFAGGVAHNCTLNGKVLASGLF
ncbi:MAG TPA: carbamoyltransferase N-terminal domain-containing protein, partial [Polyangiaceae bacterium]